MILVVLWVFFAAKLAAQLIFFCKFSHFFAVFSAALDSRFFIFKLMVHFLHEVTRKLFLSNVCFSCFVANFVDSNAVASELVDFFELYVSYDLFTQVSHYSLLIFPSLRSPPP